MKLLMNGVSPDLTTMVKPGVELNLTFPRNIQLFGQHQKEQDSIRTT